VFNTLIPKETLNVGFSEQQESLVWNTGYRGRILVPYIVNTANMAITISLLLCHWTFTTETNHTDLGKKAIRSYMLGNKSFGCGCLTHCSTVRRKDKDVLTKGLRWKTCFNDFSVMQGIQFFINFWNRTILLCMSWCPDAVSIAMDKTWRKMKSCSVVYYY
jgi:hypothetical protein